MIVENSTDGIYNGLAAVLHAPEILEQYRERIPEVQKQLSFHQKNNRHDRRWSCLLSFIFACVVVAFYPVNPLKFLLHFYAIGVWIRSENRWVLFCPVFYKSQCFQASAAFITEAEILMKPARIRRYLISFISKLLYLQWFFGFGEELPHQFRTNFSSAHQFNWR